MSEVIDFVRRSRVLQLFTLSIDLPSLLLMNFANEPAHAAPEYLQEANQLPSAENIALFKSALAGSLTGVQNALAKGGKPNFFYRPEEQENSLHVSSKQGYLDIVTELLKHGAVVDSLAGASQATSLILAAQEGHIEVVNLLLAHHANVNAGVSMDYNFC